VVSPAASFQRRSDWSSPSGSVADEHPCCCASPSGGARPLNL
jgi:hypothetical protein